MIQCGGEHIVEVGVVDGVQRGGKGEIVLQLAVRTLVSACFRLGKALRTGRCCAVLCGLAHVAKAAEAPSCLRTAVREMP